MCPTSLPLLALPFHLGSAESGFLFGLSIWLTRGRGLHALVAPRAGTADSITACLGAFQAFCFGLGPAAALWRSQARWSLCPHARGSLQSSE